MTVINLLLGKGEAYYRVKSWEKIEKEYSVLIGQGWNQQPMADLIQFIRSQGLSDTLFAATEEGATLVVSNSKKINAQNKTLYITYDGVSRLWQFKYFKYGSVSFRRKPEIYTQVCDHETGIEHFSSFIRQLSWAKSA